jgi:hypothetical protein
LIIEALPICSITFFVAKAIKGGGVDYTYIFDGCTGTNSGNVQQMTIVRSVSLEIAVQRC